MSRWRFLVAFVLSVSGAAIAAEPPPAPQAATAPPPAVTRVTTKLPLEAFARLDFIEDDDLSPNGQYLAGIMGLDGQQNIAIIPLFDKAEKIVRIGIPDKMELDWVRWVGDDNIIARVRAQDTLGDKPFYVTRLLGINRATGKITRLMWDVGGQHASDVLWVSRDNSAEILLAAQQSVYLEHNFWPKVYRVNVANGRFSQVLDGQEEVQGWSADGDGTVRLGQSHDDDHNKDRLIYRRTKNVAFRTVDHANLTARESLVDPFMFLPEGDHALSLGGTDDGRNAIYEYDLTSLQKVKTIFSPDKGRISGAIVSADQTSLLGVRLGLGGGVHWFDPKLAQVQADFDKAVPNAKVNISSLSADRSTMLVRINDADMPGSLYYYNTAGGVLQRIAVINSSIGGQHLAEVKMVHYAARDGLDIEAKLTLPTGRAPKNLPIIMLPHGGPWAHDGPWYDYLSQFLANRGYLVVQPNFRGSNGYGQDFERKGEGQLGLAMQDDISDGLIWAVKQGYADRKRACIFGWSYGGYAAMWGLVKDPDQYRCGISMAGISSLRKDQRTFDNSTNEYEAKDAWKRMTTDFDAVSPINFVDKIKAPLLLLHGKKDVRVDASQSEKMNAKMLAAGKTVQLVLMPLADHNAGRQADRVTLLTSIETFLNKYNPAD
jgi:dipeptidyl aminopeptidase/acylaminoacyl peptidase